MRYFVIGDEDTVLGFGLAGVKGIIVRTDEEAAQAFSAAVGDAETGIVIITERVADRVRGEVDRYLFSESFPLVLEIPDREGRLASKPGLRELANAAIGIKL